MTQETRKDFSEFQTHITYMNQMGLCANCGGTLDYGMGYGLSYEKHHKNKDHSDNKTENEELLCKPCHMATLAKEDKEYASNYQKYLEEKTKIYEQIISLTERAMNKELAGTVITSTIELINMRTKAVTEEYGMNRGLFYPPPSIKSMVYAKNMKMEIDAMKRGIEIG